MQQYNDVIAVGSFVLVQICTKKDKKYSVVEVNEVHDDHYRVIYLKKMQDSYKFIRAEETIYDIDRDDVLIKLPPPKIEGGTARQLINMSFGVDLSTFNMN
ncbi:hypothetical protein LSTR_LSTR009783 [Laodelphax striatellus]|uniref:Uncharacterized protein n=1 Tax=Laodelphax striatellus TaxID=195883 RepID=A0A482XN83_LAOST|nr:hypothetical protein LSTR_LSTR009783 [Laodelphax striatellus]